MCESRDNFCGTLDGRNRMLGYKCSCICHDPVFGAGVSHVVACCGCMHQYFMREDCPICNPITSDSENPNEPSTLKDSNEN